MTILQKTVFHNHYYVLICNQAGKLRSGNMCLVQPDFLTKGHHLLDIGQYFSVVIRMRLVFLRYSNIQAKSTVIAAIARVVF